MTPSLQTSEDRGAHRTLLLHDILLHCPLAGAIIYNLRREVVKVKRLHLDDVPQDCWTSFDTTCDHSEDVCSTTEIETGARLPTRMRMLILEVGLGLRLEPPVTWSAWPSGPEMLTKSQKGLPGPVGPECQKNAEKSKSLEKVSLWHFFVTFATFSALFWHSGPAGSGRFFWDFFGVSAPEGQTLPVTGRSNRKFGGF